MTFEETAQQLAARIRAGGRGFLTLRREELRDLFGIGKFTDAQATRVVDALEEFGIQVFPPPSWNISTLRVYDARHPLGEIAHAVIDTETSTDAALRRAADSFARDKAGQELRSDDVPWTEAFHLFLLLVLGRDPEGWEDVRDDRHGSMLARDLAVALGLPPQDAAESWMVRVAASIVPLRPRTRRWRADDFANPRDVGMLASDLLGALESRDRRMKEEHDRVIRAAGRLVLGGKDIPDVQVELGLLGMRRRREDEL